MDSSSFSDISVIRNLYYFDFKFSSEKPIAVDDSSSDEEPLAKKSKKQPPTVSLLVC